MSKDLRVKLYHFALSLPFVSKIYFSLRKRAFYSKEMDLVYDPKDINDRYYKQIKRSKDVELEHQIGRLNNIKKIIKNCKPLKGDFIEFGCWQGFSLLWIAYFMQRNHIFDKKLIGIDGFAGLPYSEGGFKKYLFSDTSLAICERNVLENDILKKRVRKNVFIWQALFNEKKKIHYNLKKTEIGQFCFIHIDCDVSPSVEEVFELLIEDGLIADRAYILFDDYGWHKVFKIAVDKIIDKLKQNWKIKIHSQTRLTRNYYLERL